MERLPKKRWDVNSRIWEAVEENNNQSRIMKGSVEQAVKILKQGGIVVFHLTTLLLAAGWIIVKQ